MKLLREKKNELKNQLDSMLNTCEIETRALTEEELKDYETIEANLKSIEATIEKMKGIKEGENVMTEETKVTETQTEETRALDVRAMSTTTNAAAVPTSLSNDVIKKLDEQSTVVAGVRKITVAGDYSQLVEKSTSGKAQILGESEKLNAVDLSDFETVELSDKRVATEVVVSEKLLNNAPVMAHGYITDEISKRVVRTLEDEIFNSTGENKHFGKGLIASGETTTEAITIDSIKTLVISMNPTLLNGARLYMDRLMFSKISTMKDATGEFYVQLNSVVNEAPHYVVFGVKIEISDIIPVNTIVLANVGQAYLLKQNGNMGVKMLTEKYSDVGCIGFLINTYFDGAVVDKQAVKVLKAPATKISK